MLGTTYRRLTQLQSVKTDLRRVYRYSRRTYLNSVRRALGKSREWPATGYKDEQFHRLLQNLNLTGTPIICALGTKQQNIPNVTATLVYADFDNGSSDNISDVFENHHVDVCYVNNPDPRILTNLVNFLSVYDLDVPIILGDRVRCHSLLSFVPLMPMNIVSTMHIHHYFAKNYRITDALLVQGSLYEGSRLVDCHQFHIKPDETRVIDVRKELNAEDVELGMYYLEVFHSQLPTSTTEFRFFGLYHDSDSHFMAGSHAVPLNNWLMFGHTGSTLSRTYLPNLEGTIARHVIPGRALDEISSVTTALGNELTFSPMRGMGGIEAVIPPAASGEPGADLNFDQLASRVSTQGVAGFQTLWLEDKGFALWHDGEAIGTPRRQAIPQPIEPINPAKSSQATPTVPARPTQEHRESNTNTDNSLPATRIRLKDFLASCPYLGQEFPDLNVIFDSQQCSFDLREFDFSLYTREGSLVATRPFSFNGSLQTVNLNKLFADSVPEISQGYWTITAGQGSRVTKSGVVEQQTLYDQSLYMFWGDGGRLYDSVNLVGTENQVAYGSGPAGASHIAKATGRVMSRTRKFAPFVAEGKQTSWFWLANAGNSGERIDANIKFRLYGADGSESVFEHCLLADHSMTINTDEVLRRSGSTCERGTLWLESNQCNLGAIWFLQAADGKGFAVDHFTGG